ncbi:MAG: hypothetical protein ISR76_04785 [Planctomycetes bacterium]|nr:hypothetical protein [Planctomycetota bacterium]
MNVLRSTLLLLLAWLAAGGAGFAAQGPGPGSEPEAVQRALRLYQPETWPAGPRRAGIALAELQFPFLGDSLLEYDDACFARTWQDLAGSPALRVEAVIAEDAAGARSALIPWLAWVSSPRPLLRGADAEIAVGDAAFAAPAGPGPERLAWVAFLRGNVAVRVLVLEPGSATAPDLRAAARQVDARILAAPRLEADQALPQPELLGFHPALRRCDSRQTVPLAVQFTDRSGGPALLKWEVRGSGSGYVEDDPLGQPRFYPTGPGAVELVLTVVGRFGVSVQAGARLEILDQ